MVTEVGPDKYSCRIGPKDEQQFQLAETWLSSEGRCMLEGLDTKSDERRGRVSIEPDEHWQLHYEVRAENADVVQFTVGLSVRDRLVIAEPIT